MDKSGEVRIAVNKESERPVDKSGDLEPFSIYIIISH